MRKPVRSRAQTCVPSTAVAIRGRIEGIAGVEGHAHRCGAWMVRQSAAPSPHHTRTGVQKRQGDFGGGRSRPVLQVEDKERSGAAIHCGDVKRIGGKILMDDRVGRLSLLLD